MSERPSNWRCNADHRQGRAGGDSGLVGAGAKHSRDDAREAEAESREPGDRRRRRRRHEARREAESRKRTAAAQEADRAPPGP